MAAPRVRPGAGAGPLQGQGHGWLTVAEGAPGRGGPGAARGRLSLAQPHRRRCAPGRRRPGKAPPRLRPRRRRTRRSAARPSGRPARAPGPVTAWSLSDSGGLSGRRSVSRRHSPRGTASSAATPSASRAARALSAAAASGAGSRSKLATPLPPAGVFHSQAPAIGSRDVHVERLRHAGVGLQLKRGFRGGAAGGQHHAARCPGSQARRPRPQFEPAARRLSAIGDVVVRNLADATAHLRRAAPPSCAAPVKSPLEALLVEVDGQAALAQPGPHRHQIGDRPRQRGVAAAWAAAVGWSACSFASGPSDCASRTSRTVLPLSTRASKLRTCRERNCFDTLDVLVPCRQFQRKDEEPPAQHLVIELRSEGGVFRVGPPQSCFPGAEVGAARPHPRRRPARRVRTRWLAVSPIDQPADQPQRLPVGVALRFDQSKAAGVPGIQRHVGMEMQDQRFAAGHGIDEAQARRSPRLRLGRSTLRSDRLPGGRSSGRPASPTAAACAGGW